MVQLIDGRALAEKIKDGIVKEIAALDKLPAPDKKKPGLICQRPNLAIILVGDRPDSALYVNLKEREAKRVGIDTHIYRCAADTPEREIFDTIDFLNRDGLIDAILVQLPLPAGFNTDGIIRAIDPRKDVDRFHPSNLEILFKTCEHEKVIPPVIKVVLEILKSINCDLRGRTACVVYNSEIFGKSLVKVLECRGAKCETAKINDSDLKGKTSRADILITAVGQPRFITGEMVKNDAVLIDIGITKEGGKVCGDIDFKSVKDRAAFITPVPGGVGPLTIAMLFQNTLEIYRQKHKAE
jgi:methylenetetrahydrofolate dehydrogenase (NADP+)/methenyltetrahydrofolate cyclohydrolase